MARLDRELDQAERMIGRVEGFMRATSPLRALCRRVGEGARARRRASRDADPAAVA